MKIKIICLVINRWLIGEDVVTLFDNSHVAYGAFFRQVLCSTILLRPVG